MGSTTFSNAWKNCATCNCWSGARNVNEDKTQSVIAERAVGRCDGFWKGARKYPNDKCPEWQKWAELDNWNGHIREFNA